MTYIPPIVQYGNHNEQFLDNSLLMFAKLTPPPMLNFVTNSLHVVVTCCYVHIRLSILRGGG